MQRPAPHQQDGLAWAGTDWLRKGDILLDNELDMNQTCALVEKEADHILDFINKWWFSFIWHMWEFTTEVFYPFLGSPAQERHWHTGANFSEATKLVRERSLWHNRRGWERICSSWRRGDLRINHSVLYNYLMEENVMLQNSAVGRIFTLYVKPRICYQCNRNLNSLIKGLLFLQI